MKRRKKEKQTYSRIDVLDERIPSRFPLERSRLVEEVVEVGEFTKLGEDLDEGVSMSWLI